MKIGEAVYSSQQGAGENSEGGSEGDTGSSGSSEENVVDADFEEVKDDKRSA
jgi:molecular chaperone DnaK